MDKICKTCTHNGLHSSQEPCVDCINGRGDEDLWECTCLPDLEKLQAEIAQLREALQKIDGCVESYVNGDEVGETGDKHYVYPSDLETYSQIIDIISAVLNPPKEKTND
jgi:hypothetical protein